MKRIVVCVVLFFLHVEVSAITLGEAIDRAGQQRMLSQRIAQYFLLRGIEPGSERHDIQMERAIETFQSNLDALNGNKNTTKANKGLFKLMHAWNEYKSLIDRAATKPNAKRVLEKSDEVLTIAHDYVLQLQNLSSNPGAEIVNTSGRQRMLSQRIAKNYLAEFWQVGSDDRKQQFYQDLAEFETMLNYLKSSELNTQDISKNLLKTEGHFKYASKGFDGDMTLKGKRLIFVITGTTDTMLRNMDVITKQYAKVLDASQAVVSR